MTGPLLGVDPAELAHVSTAFTNRIMPAVAAASDALVQDATISPRGFCAGLIQAHLQGLSAAIAGASTFGELTEADAMAITLHAADMIGAAVSQAFVGATAGTGQP